MTNKYNKVFYIGVTYDLSRRVYEHKSKQFVGFTSKYNLTKLIHYEIYEDVEVAINREKRLKKWSRKWKIELIEKRNPSYRDLYRDIMFW